MRILVSFVMFFVFLQTTSAQKTVLIEKFSNSHCGNCPNASLIVQDIVDENPNAIWITHYKPFEGNPLNNDQSNQLWFDFNLFGVPSILVDRRYNNGLFPSQNQWSNVVKDKLEEVQTADIKISDMVTNAFTNQLQFNLEAEFLTDPTEGEYRLSFIIVEDLVKGEPQDNYYNNVEGHPHYGLGNEIWSYEHRNVVREIAEGAWGSPNNDLINPTIDTKIIASYSYQIPADYNIDNMFIVCMISKYNPDNLEDIEVLQAAKMQLTDGVVTSTTQATLDSKINIYPNPSNDFITIGSSETIDELTIYDALGKKVMELNAIQANSSVDISNLPIGNYVIQFQIGSQLSKEKFSVVR